MTYHHLPVTHSQTVATLLITGLEKSQAKRSHNYVLFDSSDFRWFILKSNLHGIVLWPGSRERYPIASAGMYWLRRMRKKDVCSWKPSNLCWNLCWLWWCCCDRDIWRCDFIIILPLYIPICGTIKPVLKGLSDKKTPCAEGTLSKQCHIFHAEEAVMKGRRTCRDTLRYWGVPWRHVPLCHMIGDERRVP